MELAQVLHMNTGIGELSYARNSVVGREVVSVTKAITEEAIVNYYSKSLSETLVIADLGCSSGPNTLSVVSNLVSAVHNLCRKLLRWSPEFQVHFNDLPGNDFNSIFLSLQSFQETLKGQIGPDFGPCFFTGVPGSFYGRLFPAKSLHFVHSSYSLQWLSQVPDGVERKNKRNICVASTSPPDVINAYKKRFESDFSSFLVCRSEELVTGGQMVVTFFGRKSESLSGRDGCYIWELLASALGDMISEGLIEEDKVVSFNVPQYTPCPSEVKLVVLKDGSFTINRIEVSQVDWQAFGESETLTESGYNLAKCMRSVAEPLLVSHFGEGMAEEVFLRYGTIIADRMSKEKNEFTNVTIWVIKN